MNETSRQAPPATDRWTLIRDVAVLQAKLVIDGLRDLVLVPASLVAGVVSLLSGKGDRPGTQFYRLLQLGRQSERWINLFGALRNAPPDLQAQANFPDADIDALVSRIETFVAADERGGRITAQARERIDRALDRLQRKK